MIFDIHVELPVNTIRALNSQLSSIIFISRQQALMQIRGEWISQVKNQLTTTQRDYISGITVNEDEGIIRLSGKWAKMLEDGFSPFDMKVGFQKSSLVKRTNNGGWYLTIPFRHRSPNTKGTVIGGQAMPSNIYQRARLLKPGTQLTGTEILHPPRQSWTGYTHQAGIYEGMQRSKGRPAYQTFRRVSNKSDPLAFWHPGFRGVHAIEHIKTYAKNAYQQAVNDTIKQWRV